MLESHRVEYGMSKKIAFLTTIFPMNEEYLIDFFDSLKEQTYKNFDTVVVNDGYKNFENLIKKYSELNIIELKYQNTPAKNREYGINYIIDKEYDILIFGDSDDYFCENRVEKSIEFLSKYDIVVNDLSLFDESGVYEKLYISNRVKNNTIVKYDFIKDKNIFGLTNTAINVKSLKKVNFKENIVATDWFLYKNLLEKRFKAIFINETVSYYRQHQNSTIGLKVEDNIYYLWWEKK